MNKKIINELLGLGNYWTVNKTLAKKIGLNETILLQHLIELQFNLFGGNEFFQQNERLLEELPLTEWQLKQSRKSLVELKLISLVKKGVPARYHYQVLGDNIITLISNSPDLSGDTLHTSVVKSSTLVSENPPHINNILKQDINKKKASNKASNNNLKEEDIINNKVEDIFNKKYSNKKLNNQQITAIKKDIKNQIVREESELRRKRLSTIN
jgi:hypothetical protein